MLVTTKTGKHAKLPLTCTRAGTCCHGKRVLLNPWELAIIAREKKLPAHEFRSRFCDLGGIQLRFNGPIGWKGQQACSQYISGTGCSVHAGRPLACRLYPLGRQIQSNKVHYMFEGSEFPCLDGCPEVTSLPHLSVKEYLNGQGALQFEKAQDAYLEIMQNIADIAFVLLLDTGLASSGNTKTLQLWRKMGNESPEELYNRLGQEWTDCLMLPKLNENIDDPELFASRHNELLQHKAHEEFGALQSNAELHDASVLTMAIALHLARAIGANANTLAEHWVTAAKSHGALE